jgi:DegV family protein with EDD domain
MKIGYLDGKRFYRGLVAGAKELVSKQAYLNKINVFPVADADTGLNLALTVQAILQKGKIGRNLKETLKTVADSALSGARGNSGIILAQYLHGLSHELPEKGMLSAQHFATATRKAVNHLYDSLLNPVEGTMLTVIREWSDFLVEHSAKTQDYLLLFTESLNKAKTSLQETPRHLKALAEAGVVDAGASGFVFLLEGIVNYIHKGSLRECEPTAYVPADLEETVQHLQAPGKFRYCTEAIIEQSDMETKDFRREVAQLGDSLIMAGDREKLHLHIHTNDPESLFAILFERGKVSGVKIDDMQRQYEIANERKFPIGLVTDSAANLPKKILDYYQIAVIPFGLNFGQRYYLDGLSLSPRRFYEMLSVSRLLAKSSQPSPATVKNILEASLANYEKVICICLSDKLSGIYQSAMASAKGHEEKCTIVNSRQLAVTEGLLTLRVARAIESGMTYGDIVSKVNFWADNTTIYTDINTLRYMVKGGRVPPLTGFVASMLNLKPIVSLDKEGKALVYGKSFSRKRNMDKIIKIISAELKTRKLWEYAIVHAAAEERAAEYADQLTRLTGKKPLYITPLTPVVGVHNGPGTVGIGVCYDPV